MSVSYIYSGNVIDIEASGMGRDSYPIEIALVTHSGEFYHSLIAPQTHWTDWSDSAERIHGITRENITREGRSAKEVCQDINALFKGKEFYSDCWSLDGKWLSALFEAAQMTPQFTLRSIDYILNDQMLSDWNRDKSLRAKQGGICEHRALPDAQLIKNLLDERAAYLESKASKRYSLSQFIDDSIDDSIDGSFDGASYI